MRAKGIDIREQVYIINGCPIVNQRGEVNPQSSHAKWSKGRCRTLFPSPFLMLSAIFVSLSCRLSLRIDSLRLTLSADRIEVGPSKTVAAVRVPSFYRGNPAAWFRQLEVQFALAGVTKDDTQFNHAHSGLDEEAIELVSDGLEDRSYKRLKE